MSFPVVHKTQLKRALARRMSKQVAARLAKQIEASLKGKVTHG
jgi:hypothetical protein